MIKKFAFAVCIFAGSVVFAGDYDATGEGEKQKGGAELEQQLVDEQQRSLEEHQQQLEEQQRQREIESLQGDIPQEKPGIGN